MSLLSYSVLSALLVLYVERQPPRKFRLMFDEDEDKRMKEVECWDSRETHHPALNPGSRNVLMRLWLVKQHNRAVSINL